VNERPRGKMLRCPRRGWSRGLAIGVPFSREPEQIVRALLRGAYTFGGQLKGAKELVKRVGSI
jgi:hypothetical protein